MTQVGNRVKPSIAYVSSNYIPFGLKSFICFGKVKRKMKGNSGPPQERRTIGKNP